MAMELAYKLLTVEEFLDSCPNDQRHYQLIDGVIVAMAPPAIPHQIIAGNLTGEIYSAVRSNRPNCTVRSQAGIAPQGLAGRNHLQRLPSLKEILYIESERVAATVYRRRGKGLTTIEIAVGEARL